MSSAPNYSLVKKTAKGLLHKYEIDNPPIDPIMIAHSEGIGVRFVQFSGEYSGVSGFYDPEENAIYVNSEEFPLRQTFTIAHELGHALLHRDWAKSNDYKLLWRDDSLNDRNDTHEKEANAFAANLLVPRHMLGRYMGDVRPADLSRLFAVSLPVIKNRMSFEYG
ncbi:MULTISPECIES: ImmA/IrrE family metallo-endopeptidase [unclassified Haematobacter]|uniref:ImmA/IrrE family metallo-endopeptidase n=1 Tax=unclassified Haematobacter TaxID=2640585 RepID=UPI0025C0ABD3|nr:MULTISPECIES: ImmA/IrrE family metallo-endopeptidase [unclassified Haematobacter]